MRSDTELGVNCTRRESRIVHTYEGHGEIRHDRGGSRWPETTELQRRHLPTPLCQSAASVSHSSSGPCAKPINSEALVGSDLSGGKIRETDGNNIICCLYVRSKQRCGVGVKLTWTPQEIFLSGSRRCKRQCNQEPEAADKPWCLRDLVVASKPTDEWQQASRATLSRQRRAQKTMIALWKHVDF